MFLFTCTCRWAVIIGSTAVLRSVTTVPLAVHQNKLIAKIELHQPTVSMMTEALKHTVVGECRRSGLPADRADKLFKKRVCFEFTVSNIELALTNKYNYSLCCVNIPGFCL